MAKARTWAIRITFTEGPSVFERRGGVKGRGPILTFATQEAADAHAALIRKSLEPGDVATVIERSHWTADERTERMSEGNKFEALVIALRDVDSDIGMYPGAVKGFNDERDYEQRDGFKNGWNAAVIAHGAAFDKVVEQAERGISDDVLMLLAADAGHLRADGAFFLNFNDTWAWACADGEVVAADEIADVAKLFRAWGWAGLLYWATTKRPGLRSEFKDNNRFIDFVALEEAFKKAVPDSSTRAYKDLPK